VTLAALSRGELLELVSAALEVAVPSVTAEQRALVEQVLEGLLRERLRLVS
jgi:hypothetical protein